MWKTALLIVVVLVALPFAGVLAGVQIGDATCNDPEGESIPDLRCLDEVIYGSVAGLAAGLLTAVSIAVVLVRHHRRKRRAERVTRR
jgi:hypothetical protein